MGKLDILIERKEKLLEGSKSLMKEQKHLDNNTEARAYWHYGYAIALNDVLNNFYLISIKP